ncbi:hypothetical protein C5Q97_02850 [Victivallales bacterium CCUG 44730]|nr:hypothetical protein C5Q97_02850 [Victivallales bacterium CCUG 44730]
MPTLSPACVFSSRIWHPPRHSPKPPPGAPPGRFSGSIRDFPGQGGIAAGSNRPASPSCRNFEKFRRRHIRMPGANY